MPSVEISVIGEKSSEAALQKFQNPNSNIYRYYDPLDWWDHKRLKIDADQKLELMKEKASETDENGFQKKFELYKT